MGKPNSLLGEARAFARDFPRDRMPRGYLWDVLDYVPTLIDSNLTGRGGWKWGSNVMTGDPESALYAPYSNGDKLLVQTTNGRLFDVDQTTLAVTDRGALPRAKQNPIMFVDTAIHFDGASTMPPRLITNPGGVPTVGAMNAAHKNAPVGCLYNSRVVTGGAPGELDAVRFTVANQDLTQAASFDVKSVIRTSGPVSAIAALRAVILVFHGGSVERIRGATPPHDTELGDMNLEPLFDRAGCTDPKSIAHWNDNIVFADEHGVHVTDGAVIRNLASQGGILYYWRPLYLNKVSMAASTFLDYYIVTIRSSSAVPVTLICDLNKRQWFRFSNLDALCWFASRGGANMERIWAGLAGKARLARVGPCFFPDFSSNLPIADDDGTTVLPAFETPWFRIGNEGRKRLRFAYLSYDVRALVAAQLVEVGYIRSPQDAAYQILGSLPSTNSYTRYRLPLGQFPYGVGFRVRQTAASTATRIFDLATEGWPVEESRV